MPPFRHLAAVLAALAPLAPALAADSAPDPAFAAGQSDSPPGWRRSYQAGGGTQDERIVGVRRTPDGGYVLAGSIAGGGAGRLIFLHKFRRDGANDTTFGTSGRIVKDAFLSSVVDMTVDAQGRIVVVGATPGALGQADFGVVRFLASGADDASFAGDGGTSVAFDYDAEHGRVSDVPGSVATLPDGSVFVAGTISDDIGTATTTVGVVKLKPDGARDTSFSTSGNGTALYCRAQCTGVVGVARIVHDAPRNRLVIGGDFAQSANNTDWFIVTRDLGTSASSTFVYPIDRGTAGGFPLDYMRGLAVQADGKIVAAGWTTMPDLKVRGVVLRRQSTSVAEDTAFGNVAGRGLFVTTTDDTLYRDVAIDAKGRLVVVGEYAAARKGAIIRLGAAGAPDATFGNSQAETLYTARRAQPTIESWGTAFTRVALDGSQPLVAGESPDSSTAYADYDLVLMRLTTDLIFANGFQ